jgi:HlyD family secretion protein
MRSRIRGVKASLVMVAVAAVTASACSSGEAAVEGARLQTAQVERGDLTLRAEAIGTVEPVRTVEVKSKASGEILQLFADIGDEVAPGQVLAEIDPRDVRNRFDQAQADLDVAQARADIAAAQLERSQQLLAAGVITQREHESARLEDANARAALVKAITNVELAELQLADVRIRAPMAGTIIQKNVEVGTVIQSASQNVSGGTALFSMANLGDMQVRTLIDETDMGQLQPGMTVQIAVEAFPDRAFRGLLEKIEPQAVVEQNVTMFPVIVSLDNSSGLLRPGMNAEVAILIDDAVDVLLVPNNAIVQPADVGPAALALGLDVEALDLAPFMRAGRGGPGARSAGPAGDAAQGGAPGAPTEAGPRESRPAAVFVVGSAGLPEPRLVQVGLNDWDYTEVVSGLDGTETLAVVGPAQLQAQQQEFLNMMRSRASGPFGGGGPGGRGGR